MVIFEKIRDYKEHLAEFKNGLREYAGETREEVVKRVFNRVLREINPEIAEAVEDQVRAEPAPGKGADVKTLLAELTEETKEDYLRVILEHFPMISAPDRDVLYNTFVTLPVEALRGEIEDLVDNFL